MSTKTQEMYLCLTEINDIFGLKITFWLECGKLTFLPV